MENLVYLNKSMIVLEDIVRLAIQEGHRCEYFDDDVVGRGLQIFFGGLIETRRRATPDSPLTPYLHEDSWLVWEWQERSGLEPADELALQEYNPLVAFLISYHVGSLPALRDFLKALLLRYGGAIVDTDWTCPFDAATIDRLNEDAPCS